MRCKVSDGFPVTTYLQCGLLQSYKSSISITSAASNGRSLYLMVILMVNSNSNHSISVPNSHCVEFQAMCWFLFFWLTHLPLIHEAKTQHGRRPSPPSPKEPQEPLVKVNIRFIDQEMGKKAGFEPAAHGEPRPNCKQMYHNQDNQKKHILHNRICSFSTGPQISGSCFLVSLWLHHCIWRHWT